MQDRAADATQARPGLVVEDIMVPSRDPGIALFVRNKRPEGLGAPRPDRTLLMVHGATYPAHTAFDLPLGGLSWMDHIASRGFDVWCMDIRGYGRSTRPPEMDRPPEGGAPVARGETAVGDIADVAAFIRQRRGLPRLTQLGYSWGCALMGRFAADHPGLVERLVLFAPGWLRETPSATDPGGALGAYRLVTQDSARSRRAGGLTPEREAGLIPPGWFEQWAEATWATDPQAMRQDPPVLRAPNGSVADSREYWRAGRPFYDPARITAPTLLAVGEWDNDTPPQMAQTLFPLLVNAPGKRLVVLGEGTHGMWMERSRLALFRVVQDFLEDPGT